MKNVECLNCGHRVYQTFCANCGQKTTTERIGWHYLFHEVPHSIFHLDKGFFFTIKEMCLRPGGAIREFLDGKRTQYFKPLSYVFILAALAGVITLYSPAFSIFARDTETMNFLDHMQQISGKYNNFITIGLIPIFSFLIWIFYRKERNYVEVVTIHFFLFGQVNLIALLNVFDILLVDSKTLMLILSLLIGIISFVYMVWVYAMVFSSYNRAKRLIIAISATVFNNVLVAVAMLFVTAIYLSFSQGVNEININYWTSK